MASKTYPHGDERDEERRGSVDGAGDEVGGVSGGGAGGDAGASAGDGTGEPAAGVPAGWTGVVGVDDDGSSFVTLESPGAFAMHLLSMLELQEASIHARQLWVMQRAREVAEEAYLLANPRERGRGVPEWVYAEVVAEISAVRKIGRRRVEADLAEASSVVSNLPVVFDRMTAGRVTRRHGRAISDEGAPLFDARRDAQDAFERARDGGDVPAGEVERLRVEAVEAAARVVEYEERALELSEGRTAGSLKDRCHKLASRLLGSTAEERKRAARASRRVWLRDVGDGMCEVSALVGADLGAAIHDRLTQQASAIARAANDAAVNDAAVAGGVGVGSGGGAVDSRTFDQIRADVFTDLLLTSEPSEVHASGRGVDATVAITVPVLTVLDVDTEPATLDGTTPIALDDALRYVAAAPSWLRILTDPVTGVAREVDTYRPTAAQRAFIGARDAGCRFPGCRRVARRCDIDHAHAWVEGGPTAISNLECLCEWHHGLKHQTAWDVRHDPEHAGRLIWTAPSGNEYPEQPPPVGPVFTPTELQHLRGEPGTPGRVRSRHPELEAATEKSLQEPPPF